ncbi:MAG: DUF882 domain-containing protein [Burkholderiaceae bacterium]
MNNKTSEGTMITRRQLMCGCFVSSLPAIAPISALAASTSAPYATPGHSRVLRLKHLHTHELATFILPRNKRMVTLDDAKRFNYFLRDHHNGMVGSMDPSLILHLMDLQESVESKDTAFEVVSAFRSSKTNAKLRRRSKRVALNSMHLTGQAIDIRLPGTQLMTLRAAALDLKAGGVGLYKKSSFIHFDTGRVRHW